VEHNTISAWEAIWSVKFMGRIIERLSDVSRLNCSLTEIVMKGTFRFAVFPERFLKKLK